MVGPGSGDCAGPAPVGPTDAYAFEVPLLSHRIAFAKVNHPLDYIRDGTVI